MIKDKCRYLLIYNFVSNSISIFSLLVIFTSLVGCQAITDINDPTNQYTPETTYQKLVGKFPFIQIANRTAPADINEYKNITYVKYGTRHLQLDLYTPKNTQHKTLPAIIFVHCGGWRSGFRTNFTAFSIALAQRGYVTATISYRLSPEAQYPAAIYDSKNAIRWLRLNAKKFGVNPNQIVIAGGSAGGQIASLTGVTNGQTFFDEAAFNKNISSDAQAIVNIDGLSDFTSEEARFYEDDPRKNPSAAGAWLGGRYSEIPEKWHQASPTFYVNTKTPPILFLISNEKRFSLGYLEMVEKLKQSGVHFQITQIPNTPHSFWMFEPWLRPSVDAVDLFLRHEFNQN